MTEIEESENRSITSISSMAHVRKVIDKNAGSILAQPTPRMSSTSTSVIAASPSTIYGERLRRACARGEHEVVEELISRGANPNYGNGRGQNALHYAAQFGQVEVIKRLKSLCKSSQLLIDAQDKYGWTALTTAVIYDQPELVEVLLSLGANTRVCSREGRSCLHWAANKGRAKMINLLIHKGYDVNLSLTDRGGNTALHYAAMTGEGDAIIALLNAGADPSITDILDKPPSYYYPGGQDAWDRLYHDALSSSLSVVAHTKASIPFLEEGEEKEGGAIEILVSSKG